MNTIIEKIMVPIGKFFFRWRDTAFTIVFALAFYLVQFKQLAVGNMQFEVGITALGFLIATVGQVIRGVTIGYAYIKRGGLNKQIHADRLVVEGMFNHARNPLYTGNILIVTGAILVINMFWYYAVALPAFYIIYMAITLAEEKFLKAKFGNDYSDYMRKVNRFIPHRFAEWNQSIAGMDFTWKRLAKKEHGSFFILYAALLAFTVLKFYFRYGLQLTSSQAVLVWILLGVLIVFQVSITFMKKTGRLEWDPSRP
jgi:protein-S-isoprenylcysteine O-methyltransferase Ste14